MSSILKALRKLESEKSELGEGSVDLARDILKRSYDERRASPTWLIAALVATAVLLGAGWWLYAPEQQPQPMVVQQPLQLEPVVPILPVASEVPPAPLQPVVVMPNPVSVTSPEKLQQQVKPAVKTLPSKVTETTPLVIPDLTIEEIVYVADPGSRLAVINDLPVMQGTDIEGARVVEILSDRVRFEFKGVRFDKFKSPSN
ncbi:MAG TPA: general secretion pathway protein GspB [Malonomonas sp.]